MSNKIGTKIKTIRKEKGLSIEALGKLSGISKSYIWDIENRDRNNPTASKLIRIANVLGVTMEYLMENIELSDSVLEKAFLYRYARLSIPDKINIYALMKCMLKGYSNYES